MNPDGTVVTDSHHAFKGVSLTSFSKSTELLVVSAGYLKIPGEKTSTTYFIDDALRDAGYDVRTTADPTVIKIVWEEGVRLLTSNGPHAMDEHTARLRTLLPRH